jgi:hypothetical protein
MKANQSFMEYIKSRSPNRNIFFIVRGTFQRVVSSEIKCITFSKRLNFTKRNTKGGCLMKLYWILPLMILALTLVSCNASPVSAEQPQSQPTADTRPRKGPIQEPAINSPGSDSNLPQLPAPTVGSVVITNTTATPVSPGTSASALTPTPALQELAEKAKTDLADRLKVSVDQIDLLKIVPAKWPYDSVGCPLPDGVSIDTSTPGYQILLNANDEQYMYHTDGKSWIGLCNVKPPNEIRTLP